MASVVGEAFDSRNQRIGWKDSTCDLKYIVVGTEDESAVREAVQAIVPATYTPTSIGGQTLPTLILDNYTLEHKGGGIWYVVGHYSQISPRKPNDNVYNFEIGGGTQKIFSSLNQSVYTPPNGLLPGTPPNFNGLIGVTADSVEGVEIQVPKFSWSEVHYIPIANVTSDYIAALENVAANPVNNGTWRGKNAGEILFQGCTGQQRGQDDWEITFKFSKSPNLSNQTIGNVTGINKGGWDYLWIRYQDAVDGASNSLTKKILAVVVDQTYTRSDFTTLGIGS